MGSDEPAEPESTIFELSPLFLFWSLVKSRAYEPAGRSRLCRALLHRTIQYVEKVIVWAHHALQEVFPSHYGECTRVFGVDLWWPEANEA
jgi:hypothetical protein